MLGVECWGLPSVPVSVSVSVPVPVPVSLSSFTFLLLPEFVKLVFVNRS